MPHSPVHGKIIPIREPDHISYPVFKPFTLAFMRANPLPPRDMLIGRWLAEGSLTLIHGPRGVGKTRLALAIAHAVASGTSLLGWHIPKPRRVLHVDGEMRIDELQAACATLPAPATDEHLRFLVMDVEREPLDLTLHSHRYRLDDHLEGTDLIILDNLATLAAGAGENAVETWQPIEAWAREQSHAGRAIIFIHHSGRLGHQRGTTRREDRMDTILALRPLQPSGEGRGPAFELHLQKHRGALPASSFPLAAELGPDGGHATTLDNDPTAEIAELTRAGHSIRTIANLLDLPRSTVHRLQYAARRTGQLAPVPPVPAVPPVPNPVPSEMGHPPPLASAPPGATTPPPAEGPA